MGFETVLPCRTSMLRKVYYSLSPPMRMLARRVVYFPIDLVRSFVKSESIAPPKGLVYTGSGDFKAVGEKYLAYFIQFAGLSPHHSVLDIGCGIGRMALPLTQYLDKDGSYDGFDVVKQGIEWCQKNIGTKYPNFRFLRVPLKNDLYTSDGRDATSFEFPYPDDFYDLVIAISVFTHMIHAEVENYLSQSRKVLHTRGYLFTTFFILDETSRKAMKERQFRFDHASAGCYLMDARVRSANVAYDEAELMRMIERHKFDLIHRIHGNWSGRTDASGEFQDILVLKAR